MLPHLVYGVLRKEPGVLHIGKHFTHRTLDYPPPLAPSTQTLLIVRSPQAILPGADRRRRPGCGLQPSQLRVEHRLGSGMQGPGQFHPLWAAHRTGNGACGLLGGKQNSSPQARMVDTAFCLFSRASFWRNTSIWWRLVRRQCLGGVRA